MILLIDNYDSFTFNVKHYLLELGENVKVVRNDKIAISKIAKLKPLYKKGSKLKPENYRPISLLPIISKVFAKIIHSQTQLYLDDNNILYKFLGVYHFGFFCFLVASEFQIFIQHFFHFINITFHF